MLVRGFHDAGRDRRVHRVEIVTGVVQQVERFERDAFAGQLVDRRVTAGARVPLRYPLQRSPRRGQQQVDSGRPETDHDHTRSFHPPAGRVDVVTCAAFFSR